MESCYSSQTLLHLGKDSICSCCGVQQGDPLGLMGFALTPPYHRAYQGRGTHSCLKCLVPPRRHATWRAPGDISAAPQIVESDGSLCCPPTQQYCDASHSPLLLEVAVTRAGFCLLGVPPSAPLPFARGCFRQGCEDQGVFEDTARDG